MFATNADTVYYVVLAPVSVTVAVLALWLSQRGERRERAELERERAERDSRLHGAVFGYREGNTIVPGILEVVVGTSDQDGLGKIAREARDTASAIATKQTKIEGDVDHLGNLAEAAAVMSSDAKDAGEQVHALVSQTSDATKAAVEELANHIDEDLRVHEGQREELHNVDGKLTQLIEQVKTINGASAALLVERAEGRRIERDIPAEDRTTSEQNYVDSLRETGRDLGHTGPDDRTVGPEGDVMTEAERRELRDAAAERAAERRRRRG